MCLLLKGSRLSSRLLNTWQHYLPEYEFHSQLSTRYLHLSFHHLKTKCSIWELNALQQPLLQYVYLGSKLISLRIWNEQSAFYPFLFFFMSRYLTSLIHSCTALPLSSGCISMSSASLSWINAQSAHISLTPLCLLSPLSPVFPIYCSRMHLLKLLFQ